MATRAGSWIKGGKPRLFLAALGKHPAWDDHMELGLESDALVRVRRQLYVEGIGAAIDGGAWDKLAPDEALPAFGHVFLWRFDQELVVGRMWASKDGKGRSKYPMLACFHAGGVGAGWALRELGPRLERIEAACIAATTHEGVAEIITRERDAARAAMGGEGPEAIRAPLPSDLASLAAAPELGPDRRGLLRILYECERDLSPWRDPGDAKSSGSGVVSPTGHRLRMPVPAGAAATGLARWVGVVFSLAADSAPVFAAAPHAGAWVDVIVGDLSASHLACLKATPRKMALTSDVPYTLDESFVARARAMIDAGGATPAPPAARPDAGPARPAWLKWAGLGAIGAGVVIGGVLVAGGGGGPGPTTAPEPSPQPTPLVREPEPAPRPDPTPDPIVAAAPREPSPPVVPVPVPAEAPSAGNDNGVFWDSLPAVLGEGAVAAAWRRGVEQIRAEGGPVPRAREQVEAWKSLLAILAEAPRREVASAGDRAVLDAARERAWESAIEVVGDARAATALASAQARVRAGLVEAVRRHAELESAAADAATALAALTQAGAGAAEGVPDAVASAGDRLGMAAAAALPSALRVSEELKLWAAQPARSPDELAAEARDSNASPWRRVWAWRRLGEKGWPAGPAQLRAEAEIQASLAALPGAAALEALRRSESESRWLRGAGATGLDADALRATIATIGPLGLPPGIVSKAPRAFQVAKAALDLRDAIARPGIDDAATRVAVDTFLSASAAAGGSHWDEGLRAVITPPKVAPPLAGVGPASVGWKAEVSADGTRVTYASPRGGASIEFIRLEGVGGPDAATFLSASEVSLAQFIEVAAPGWDSIRPLLRAFDEFDPRLGPRVWTWSAGPGDPIRRAANLRDPTLGWIATMGRDPSYYAEDPPAGPDLNHPMQQVSARAAIAAARLVGCRLPTSAEWRAAHAAGPATVQNLRDARWERQWRFLQTRGRVEESEWPGAGVFRPADLPALRPAEDSSPAVTHDDGILWFAPASGPPAARSAAGYFHLVGNVAEWVFEAPEAIERLTDVSPKSLTDLIGDGAALRVIGASALSPGDMEATRPAAVDHRRARDGFSDIGFRLAFVIRGVSPPTEVRSLRERVEEVVRSFR